jgi:hypothetical protein
LSASRRFNVAICVSFILDVEEIPRVGADRAGVMVA